MRAFLRRIYAHEEEESCRSWTRLRQAKAAQFIFDLKKFKVRQARVRAS